MLNSFVALTLVFGGASRLRTFLPPLRSVLNRSRAVLRVESGSGWFFVVSEIPIDFCRSSEVRLNVLVVMARH